jgi:hypothetical protein
MQTPQLIGITFGFCEFRWLINLNFLRSWLTMSRFSKRKIAASLAFASLLSGRASAADTNNAQNPQTVAAVRGGRAVKNQPKKIDWKKIVKIGGFTVAGLVALETIHSIIGGFTDSKVGIGSIGRVIRNRVKKNEQPDSGKPKESNSNDENDELKKDNEKDIKFIPEEKNDEEKSDKENIIVDGDYKIDLNERENDKGDKTGNILISGKVINENIGKDEKDIEKCNMGLINKIDEFAFNKVINKKGEFSNYILNVFENFKKIDKENYNKKFDKFHDICANKCKIYELRICRALDRVCVHFFIDDNIGYEIVMLKKGNVRIFDINSYTRFDFLLEDKNDEDNGEDSNENINENEDEDEEDSDDESLEE